MRFPRYAILSSALVSSVGLLPLLLGPLVVVPPKHPLASREVWTGYVTFLLCFLVWHSLEYLITRFFKTKGTVTKLLTTFIGGGLLLAVITITRDKFSLYPLVFAVIVGAVSIGALRQAAAERYPNTSLLLFGLEAATKGCASILVLHRTLELMPLIYSVVLACGMTGFALAKRSAEPDWRLMPRRLITILLAIPPVFVGLCGMLGLLPSPFIACYVLLLAVPSVTSGLPNRAPIRACLYLWCLFFLLIACGQFDPEQLRLA